MTNADADADLTLYRGQPQSLEPPTGSRRVRAPTLAVLLILVGLGLGTSLWHLI